jgi:hypothetical protein
VLLVTTANRPPTPMSMAQNRRGPKNSDIDDHPTQQLCQSRLSKLTTDITALTARVQVVALNRKSSSSHNLHHRHLCLFLLHMYRLFRLLLVAFQRLVVDRE